MKTYSIEPTYKKSVCEVELWRRSSDILPTDSDDETYRYNWNGPILRRECWWRWGEWTMMVPETDHEIQEFVQQNGFATLMEYLEHHHGAETIEEVLLPDTDEDEHVLPSEAECNYCWDGQGEEFTIEKTKNLEMTEEECALMSSEAMRMYADEGLYEEGLEVLGWEHYSTIYEIYCALKVTLQEKSEEEKLEIELAEFRGKLEAAFNLFPEKLGGLFERDDGEGTKYEHAVARFGIDKTFQVIDDCIPFDKTLLYKGTALQPFMAAASQENSSVSVIYHLLRKDPSSVLDLEMYL